MAGISTSPLLPFRKHEPPKPLHSRWGDVSITVPTEGSWSQYHNSQRQQQRHSRKADYELGYVPEYSSARARAHPRLHLPSDNEEEEEDESISTYTSSSFSADSMSSRRSSIMSTLNPRRLSMRLTSSRPKSSTGTHDDRDHLITDRSARTEFAYKPIKMDYPAEVAETKATTISTNSSFSNNNNLHRTNSHSSRFRYIPTPSRYREEFAEIPPPLRSQSVSSRRSQSRAGSSAGCVDERRSRSRKSDYDEYDDDHQIQMMSINGPRVGGSVGRAKRAPPSSAKFLTTAMVPDPDEIYE